MLDIARCLYDAIARLEKAAEQGSAIAAAVEGVERQLGGNFSGIALHILSTNSLFSSCKYTDMKFIWYILSIINMIHVIFLDQSETKNHIVPTY